jgi:hypothetical protein
MKGMSNTRQHGDGSAIWSPLIFLVIGICLILFPDAIVRGEPWDKLSNKHSFAVALGVSAIGFAVGSHAHGYWGARGFDGVSFWGRLVGGWAAVFGFLYVFWSIIEFAGWPWE